MANLPDDTDPKYFHNILMPIFSTRIILDIMLYMSTTKDTLRSSMIARKDLRR